MRKFKVWGISGKAETGKDYIYNNFFKKIGFYNFSLAWHLKINVVGKGLATHEEVFVTKPPHVRKILQEEGTERGRLVYGENLWTSISMEWMTLLNESWGVNNFFVPDVRFHNEAEFIKSNGGVLLRVHAPQRANNSKLNEEARKHPSEIDLDNYEGFDYIINNDYTDDVYSQMMNIFHKEGVTWI